MEWELDVDECGYGLDGSGLLGMVDEVALAGLVFGEPVEDVELGVVGPRTGRRRLLWRRGRRCEGREWIFVCLLELG